MRMCIVYESCAAVRGWLSGPAALSREGGLTNSGAGRNDTAAHAPWRMCAGRSLFFHECERKGLGIRIVLHALCMGVEGTRPA